MKKPYPTRNNDSAYKYLAGKLGAAKADKLISEVASDGKTELQK